MTHNNPAHFSLTSAQQNFVIDTKTLNNDKDGYEVLTAVTVKSYNY
jgi:hypothetical protein